MENDPVRYVFLMRHGAHKDGVLTSEAIAHLDGLVERLAEWMQYAWRDEPDRQIEIRRLTAGPAPEVDATADRLTHSYQAIASRFGPADRLCEPAADREVDTAVGPYDADATTVEKHAQDLREKSATTRTPLLVTNAPLVEWIAYRLTHRRTPFERGELACFECPGGSDRWRLRWTISADGPEEAAAIRAKIHSKMNVATALGAVIVGLLTFVITDALPAATPWHWSAAAALGLAALLYFASLFLYDGLQMPPRFWASRGQSGGASAWQRLRHGKRLVARPPSSTARVLHAGMLRVWLWIFTPATALVGLGTVLLAIGAAQPDRTQTVAVQPWQVALVALCLSAIAGLWIAFHRPDLGSAD